jgi:ABC-type cobalt transport system substrate-binding protein
MLDAPDVFGEIGVSRAQGWKETTGRLGLVGQGVVATIIGLLAIRIAIGEKDEAATSEGAVVWLADQPLVRFLLVALTVALFALALWRFLCAVMGDPVEGSEPKDRLKYAVLGVVYLLLAITTLGVTIANWTGSDDTAASEETGDESSQQAASTLFEAPAGRWLVGILGVAIIGYAGYNLHKQVIKRKFAERLDAGDRSWIVRLGLIGYTAQSLVYAVVGYFFVQAAIAFKSTTAKGPSGALIELADTTWGKVLLWIIAIGLFAFGVFCIAEAKYRKAASITPMPERSLIARNATAKTMTAPLTGR